LFDSDAEEVGEIEVDEGYLSLNPLNGLYLDFGKKNFEYGNFFGFTTFNFFETGNPLIKEDNEYRNTITAYYFYNENISLAFSVFNDSFNTTIFNGGIKLSTVFSNSTPINREKRIITTQKNISLSDLKIGGIDELNNFIKITNKLKLNLDITNLSNYAAYGSLKEKFRFSINNIIK
jgi:hypothetical protein